MTWVRISRAKYAISEFVMSVVPVATGNWSMVVNNVRNSSFTTNMTWYNNNGTGTHTHELQNFMLTEQPKITVQPGTNVALKGLMDVGTNHHIVWHNVHSIIYIKGGKRISISLDDQETNHHFAGQANMGLLIRSHDVLIRIAKHAGSAAMQ
jgi:hypothetical protein